MANVPAMHVKHCVAALTAANVPTAHGAQLDDAVWPLLAEYSPATHATQPTEPELVWNMPALQLAHADAAENAE